MPPSEARRQAALALGGEEKWKEAAWAERSGATLELWSREFRLAWRGLWRRPGFAALAILILALGIGASTAMFSAVQAVLINPLPFTHPSRLVALRSADRLQPGSQAPLSYPDFLDLRQTTVFSAMAAYAPQDMTLTGRGAPVHEHAYAVSANLFQLLGAAPLDGRAFLPGEDQPGTLAGTGAVILSYATAQSKFGSAGAAVGQAVTLG